MSSTSLILFPEASLHNFDPLSVLTHKNKLQLTFSNMAATDAMLSLPLWGGGGREITTLYVGIFLYFFDEEYPRPSLFPTTDCSLLPVPEYLVLSG